MPEKKSIIIFSSDSEASENIALAAGEYGFESVSLSDGSNARELLSEKHFDMAFVNTPLEKEFGLDLAVFASQKGCCVIISAAAKHCDEIARKIGDLDIFILPRPIRKAALLQTFRFVILAKETQNGLNSKTEALENKLRDVKLIDRAKCVLVEYLRISEADAHRQIQKRAMDMHVPQVVIAQDILKTYEMRF